MAEKHRGFHDIKSWAALGFSTLALTACVKPPVPQQLPTNTPTNPAVLEQGTYFLQREKPVKVGGDTVIFHQYDAGICTVDINGKDTFIPIDNAQAFPEETETAAFEVVCDVEKQKESAVIFVFDSVSEQKSTLPSP